MAQTKRAQAADQLFADRQKRESCVSSSAQLPLAPSATDTLHQQRRHGDNGPAAHASAGRAFCGLPGPSRAESPSRRARRLMSQPGNYRSLGPLLDRDSPGPGHRAATNRRGMSGDDAGQPVGVERQERDDGAGEVFTVRALYLVMPANTSLLSLGVAVGGSLSFEFSSNAVDGSPPWDASGVRHAR